MRGLAIAVYEYGDTKKLTASSLLGASKDEIRVDTTIDFKLEEGRLDLALDAFTGMRSLVHEIVRKQGEEIPDFEVPVVYGMEVGLDVEQTYRDMVACFDNIGSLLDYERKLLVARAMELTFGDVFFFPSPQEIAQTQFQLSLERLILRTVTSQEVQLHPRRYRGGLMGPDGKQKLAEAARRSIGSDAYDLFLRHYSLVKSGEDGTRAELEATTRLLGSLFAQGYLRSHGLSRGDHIEQRYFGCVPFQDGLDPVDIRNFLFAPPLLPIMSDAFVEETGISHNFCLKSTLVPRSPPFSDVTATYMADQMDLVNQTSPCAVLVNHY